MPAAQHTPGLVTGSQAEGYPGSTHESGIRYPGRLSDRSKPLSKWADLCQIYELLFRRISLMLGLHCEKTDQALKVAVFEGVYAKSDGTKVTFAGNASFTVPDDTTDYKLWVLAADNTLYGGTSWPADATTYVAVAMVTTADGAVTQIKDARPYNSLRITPTYTDNGQTAQPVLLIDADNEGAGVDMAVRFNRGTDGGGEDAELEWDEANDRFNLAEKHTTGTLAKLNLLELLISGTKLLDADGAAKVAAAVAGDGLAHAAGVLSVGVDDSTIEIDTDKGRLKDGGITTQKLGDTLADDLAFISVPDASGPNPQTITIQAQDAQGNNLAEVVYLEVGVFDDADGQTEATNATIADGGAGSFLDAISANKRYRAKTDSSGQLQVQITDGTPETAYVLAGPTRRSGRLNCEDIGTVTIT